MSNNKTINALTRKYNSEASRDTIKTTLHHLSNIEANFRSDARIALEIGLPAKTERLLYLAACLREASNLIKTHALPQD